MKILIIEDEYRLADLIKNRLKEEKYLVDIETDGYEGYLKALTNVYDLIVLDISLPKMNGFQILNGIKNQDVFAKVIMLTARVNIEDKLTGLNEGANDYLTKPFHIEELVARINIQLKQNIRKKELCTFGDLELNVFSSTLKCTQTNSSLEIICKEFQLLEYFMNNPKQILDKEQIYDKVWGIDNESESNNLEVYISFIRKKLKAIGSKVTIKSVRNLGYKMEYLNE